MWAAHVRGQAILVEFGQFFGRVKTLAGYLCLCACRLGADAAAYVGIVGGVGFGGCQAEIRQLLKRKRKLIFG